MNRYFTLALFLCLALAAVSPIQLNATTTPPIDDKAYNTWLWCNDCASDNGNTNAVGGVANVTQPGYTIDGSSVRFDLNKNCTSPCGYGNVFFYNNLAQSVSESSVTIDMFAMMDSAGINNSQAVEFTVEDNVCKTDCGLNTEQDFRYIYSLQCDFPRQGDTSSGKWRVWNGSGNAPGKPPGSGAWVPTQYNCVRFTSHQFVHLVFHFLRSQENVTYTDMVINGVSYPINVTYGIQYDTPNHQSQFLASVQLDGNSTQGEYSMWADKWTVTYQ